MSQVRSRATGEVDDEVPPTPQPRVPRVPDHELPEQREEQLPELSDDEVVSPPEPTMPPVEERGVDLDDDLDDAEPGPSSGTPSTGPTA